MDSKLFWHSRTFQIISFESVTKWHLGTGTNHTIQVMSVCIQVAFSFACRGDTLRNVLCINLNEKVVNVGFYASVIRLFSKKSDHSQNGSLTYSNILEYSIGFPLRDKTLIIAPLNSWLSECESERIWPNTVRVQASIKHARSLLKNLYLFIRFWVHFKFILCLKGSFIYILLILEYF